MEVDYRHKYPHLVDGALVRVSDEEPWVFFWWASVFHAAAYSRFTNGSSSGFGGYQYGVRIRPDKVAEVVGDYATFKNIDEYWEYNGARGGWVRECSPSLAVVVAAPTGATKLSRTRRSRKRLVRSFSSVYHEEEGRRCTVFGTGTW